MHNNNNKAFHSVLIVITLTLLFFSSALANTSGWWFQAVYDGRIINGKANGIQHQMTQGNLSINGTLITNAIPGGANGNAPWYFEIRLWSNDNPVCRFGPINTPNNVGDAVGINQNCGNMQTANYYLFIYRNFADNREVNGSGNLVTQ